MENTSDVNENWTSTTTTFKSQLQTFYEGANVFITGGTGFVGKLLIEKLLRCTDVNTIYMLIREKKGKTVEERLDEYFNDVVFQRLKTTKPRYKHKIVPIQGDCTLAGLGLSLNNRNMITKDVNVVFHVAATVNFDEKLRLAYSINVKGTESVLDLCKHSENLKAFVYVSTAYSNCYLKDIDEIFYDIVNYKDIEIVLQKMNDEKVDYCTKKILGKWPNTYTFTKALAESVIRDQGNGVPVGIFRPGIVTSTYKEPLEGWIDNLYGPTGACMAAASGILRILQCNEDNTANIVPADMCVSALTACAWDIANVNHERRTAKIPIYNYVSSKENPLTWREYYAINRMYEDVYPLSNALWCVKFLLTSNPYVYNFGKLVYHYIPGLCFDFLGLFLGKKPRFLKLYSKVHKFSDVITYFAMTDCYFSNDNVGNLWKKMNEKDKSLFPFNVATINWISYFKTYILGIRVYLLKDSLETLPQAKIRQAWLQVLHRILMTLFWCVSMNFVWNTIANNIYSYTRRGLTFKR